MAARERGRFWTRLLQCMHFWTLKHLLGVGVGDASSSYNQTVLGERLLYHLDVSWVTNCSGVETY